MASAALISAGPAKLSVLRAVAVTRVNVRRATRAACRVGLRTSLLDFSCCQRTVKGACLLILCLIVTFGAWPISIRSPKFCDVSSIIRKQFGDRVRELREASGLSQEAFADQSGFARSYVSRVERGRANPSIDAVEVIAVALAVEVADLFIRSARTAPGCVLVPFASDGTCFHPGLMRPRARTYCVGDKSATKHFHRFEDALSHLREMAVAKWWRPNESGQWGLVTAIRWAALP